MTLDSGIDQFPFSKIPPIWFVHRREYLETHYQDLVSLKDKLSRFAGGQNVLAILHAAESLDKLNELIEAMEKTFESHLLPFVEQYNPYHKYDLKRIKELSRETSNHLQALAVQMSWGNSYEKQAQQIKRNLYPLMELVGDILAWLERVI
jgi:hemoglobin-like flavoprotein